MLTSPAPYWFFAFTLGLMVGCSGGLSTEADASIADASIADAPSSDSPQDVVDGQTPIECEDGLVVCGGACCDPATLVELPVEVLGSVGTTAERSFELTVEQASATRRLWLQVNNLGYENKASVQVNSGEWLSLNHETAELAAPEMARGGMVLGGYNTVRLTIPASGFTAGENTVRFRYDTADGLSIGYRVVSFDLLDNESSRVLSDARFYEVDPNAWEAPIGDEAAIAEGEDLWRTAPLLTNDLEAGTSGNWYAAPLPARQPIRAACADCHTQDGRDLEIFSYSNLSIIERAKFHGLSELEGEKIASYIRSLSVRHESVGRFGRPWNPPYQPGPSVADRPIHEWAAGAGLDAVLESDADMLPWMIEGEVNAESVMAYFDSAGMEDHTTLPIAIQLPDWKHWLPLIHPMDAYASDGYYEDEGVEYNPTRGYAEVRTFFEARPASERSGEEILNALARHWLQFRRFLSQDAGRSEHWRTRDGSANTRGLGPGASIAKTEIAATSLARLMAVKHFELMNEFGLQDQALRIIDAADQPGERQWLGRDYQVFEVPPHFTACFDDEDRCQHFEGQPEATGQYESTAWYHLQLVLNGGQGMIEGNSPVDNNYHPEFILRSNRSSDILEPLRYYSSLNAMYQTRTWTGGTSPNNGRGFRIRIQGPWYFLGKEADARRNHFHGFDPGFYPSQLDEVTPGLTRWVLDALLTQFTRELARPENDLSIWDRWAPGIDPSNSLDPRDKDTVVDVTEFGPGAIETAPLWADHMMWAIPASAEFGARCQLVHQMVDWAQAAWPRLDFEQWRGSPRVVVQLVQDEDGVRALVGNGGSSPAFTWTVNESSAAAAGDRLDDSMFAAGDRIGVSVESDEGCLSAGRRQGASQEPWVAD